MDQKDQFAIHNLIQTALMGERKRIADALRLVINQHLSESAVFRKHGDAAQAQAEIVREALEAFERALRKA